MKYYYMYIITRSNNTISGVNNILYNTIDDALQDAKSEFQFNNSAYNYFIDEDNFVEFEDEITYKVYNQGLYAYRGKLSYLINIIRMKA